MHTTIAKIKIRPSLILLVLNGWFVWLFNLFLQIILPESQGIMIFQLFLICLGILAMVAGMLLLVMPRDRQFIKLVETGSLSTCVICKSVQDFLTSVNVHSQPEISYVQEYNLYSGNFEIPAIKTATGSISKTTLTATDPSREHVSESLYMQAHKLLLIIPAYKEIQANLARSTDSSHFVTVTHEAKIQRQECDHFLLKAREQELVSFTRQFEQNVICPEKTNSMCTFTLVPGTSSIKKAVDAEYVTLRTKVAYIGSPPKGKVFKCSELGIALPYLLNGYTPAEHS